MGVEELPLAIMREIRGKNAVGGALPALVFTSSACLGGVYPCSTTGAAAVVVVMHYFQGWKYLFLF